MAKDPDKKIRTAKGGNKIQEEARVLRVYYKYRIGHDRNVMSRHNPIFSTVSEELGMRKEEIQRMICGLQPTISLKQ